jgi:serine O-acetyltransferase (EC 2.3.1.30)
VVVKAVPPGATVVGVPGRIIEPDRDATSRRRADTAKRIGFDAYGATRDAPDPVANAINRMLDHIHHIDQRLESMSYILERHGLMMHFDHDGDIDAMEIEPATRPDIAQADDPTQARG